MTLDAFRRFGNGPHPAGLNFGDGLSCALAKATGKLLLFRGDDFAQTDVARPGRVQVGMAMRWDGRFRGRRPLR